MLNKPPSRFGRFGPAGSFGSGSYGAKRWLAPSWACLSVFLVLVVLFQLTVFRRAAWTTSRNDEGVADADCDEKMKPLVALLEKRQLKIDALERQRRRLEEKLGVKPDAADDASGQPEGSNTGGRRAAEAEDEWGAPRQGGGVETAAVGTKKHREAGDEGNAGIAAAATAKGAQQKTGIASSEDPNKLQLAPSDPKQARALLIICYNRPDYLRRTLEGVIKALPLYNRPHIYVSQDGDHPAVANVIREAGEKLGEIAPDVPFTHLQHTQDHARNANKPWGSGYYYLAQHFGWALNKLFVETDHPRVIILEDDLDISPDFFNYFSAVESVLDNDPTLLAASAYSDLGQAQFVSDSRRLYRSDFFPGLGWMMTKKTWDTDIGPKWPDSFWDDWLREPPQRKNRAVIRPEVSRTFTFGVSGVSQAQFYAQYLGNIKLNDENVDWRSISKGGVLDRMLNKERYDAWLKKLTLGAREVSLDQLGSASCDGTLNADDEEGLQTVKALYSTFDGPGGYAMGARSFGFIDDVKAGVPRTAYRGVTIFKHKGCRKLLVDAEKQSKL